MGSDANQSAMSKATTLAPEMSRAELVAREHVIERGKQAFVEVGTALAEIRDRRGYRFEFKTFDEYCRARWDMSMQNAHLYIDASYVVKALPAETSRHLEVSAAAELAKLTKSNGKGNGARKEIDVDAVREIAGEIDFTKATVKQVANKVDARLKGQRQQAQQAKAAAAMQKLRQDAAVLPPDDRYRLLHGDVLEMMYTLDDNSVHLIVTSPPYPGVPELWGEHFASENFDAAHAWLDRVWDECVRVLVPGGHLVINIGNVGRVPVLGNNGRVQQYKHPHADFVGEIIWDQLTQGGNTAWGTYANPTAPHLCDDHEYLIVFQKRGARRSPLRSGPAIDPDDFKEWRRSIWRIPPASAKRENHPAPFPREIPHRFITLYTFPGETVLDPFMGSGTTIFEAVCMDRFAIGIDHSDKCIDQARGNLYKALQPTSPMSTDMEPEAE